MKRLGLLSFGFLVACSVDVSQTGGSTQATSCAAAQFQYLKWQKRSVLGEVALPEPYRIYNRDDPVTLEFRPDRLNIVIGNTERIEAIQCG